MTTYIVVGYHSENGKIFSAQLHDRERAMRFAEMTPAMGLMEVDIVEIETDDSGAVLVEKSRVITYNR